MAVTVRDNTFYDHTTRRQVEVHSITVTKSNKKGAAEAVGGALINNPDGSFVISLTSKVNGNTRTILVYAGQIVFRTNNSNRWQVLNKPQFNKRFSVV